MVARALMANISGELATALPPPYIFRRNGHTTQLGEAAKCYIYLGLPELSELLLLSSIIRRSSSSARTPNGRMGRHQNAEEGLQDQTNILPRRQLLIVTTAVAASLLISFVDQNAIGVALPTIGRELNAANTISWAGTSSFIGNAAFAGLCGRLSDIFGRKLVYFNALALLCLADLLCGLSRNAPMFYVFRGFAGIAGGGISSLTMIIVSDAVTLEDRGKYQGILGACMGAGNVIGPFVSAAFTQRATWRGIFYLISPLAAVGAVIAWLILPSTTQKGSMKKNVRNIDFYGILTFSVGIIFVLIPISGGGSYFSWDTPIVISMLAIGGCSLILFLFVEWKVATLPMLPGMDISLSNQSIFRS
jgi:MFS family permease